MRKLLLFLIVIIVGITFIARLFYLQVFSSKAYNIYDDNAIRKVFHYPKRGYVYDRNGELLVANQPSYDVMVIPNEVMPLDTLEFCSLLKIEKEKFLKFLNFSEKNKTLMHIFRNSDFRKTLLNIIICVKHFLLILSMTHHHSKLFLLQSIFHLFL